MNKFKTLRDELTDDNCHTDALIVWALEHLMYDVVAELAMIAKQHEEDGFLTPELSTKRDELEKAIKVETKREVA